MLVHILDENSDNPGQNSLGPLHPAPLCNVVSYCTVRAMICATNIDGGCGGCFRACLHVSGPTILAGIVGELMIVFIRGADGTYPMTQSNEQYEKT